MDWNLVLVALLAGFIPLAWLMAICLAFVVHLILRPREYEVELLHNISPADAGKIAAAVARRGYDVTQFHDEKVGLTHLLVKRQKRAL
jgi:hypothetical protein